MSTIIQPWETHHGGLYNTRIGTSHGSLTPYRHGGLQLQISAPKVAKILFGRPVFGETFAIHGPKRTGKTLLAMFILVERLVDEEDDIPAVLSNVNFDLTPIGMQDKFVLLRDIEQIKEFEGGIIFIDEIRRYADSYMTQSQQSRFVSNLLADTGKQKDDFYYTDQDVNGPPKRVRGNVDYVFAPFYDDSPFSNNYGWCYVYWFDSLNSYDMFFNPMFQGMSKPIYEFAFDARPYFKYYNTQQKIEQFHMKFHPEIYVKDFTEWHEKNHSDQKINMRLLDYWDLTEGTDLSKDEKQAVLTNMRFSGVI